MILALGRSSLGARARRLSKYHQKCQANSGIGAAIPARWRLAPAAAVVIMWFKDINVIFIMFGLLCTSRKFMQCRFGYFKKKKQGTCNSEIKFDFAPSPSSYED
jgi:hypothetical protein